MTDLDIIYFPVLRIIMFLTKDRVCLVENDPIYIGRYAEGYSCFGRFEISRSAVCVPVVMTTHVV